VGKRGHRHRPGHSRREPGPGNIAGASPPSRKNLWLYLQGGTKTLEEVIKYAYPPTKKGLVLMDTPGHDIDQLTGMMAGGPRSRSSPPGGERPPVAHRPGHQDLGECGNIQENEGQYRYQRECGSPGKGDRQGGGQADLRRGDRRGFGKLSKAEKLDSGISASSRSAEFLRNAARRSLIRSTILVTLLVTFQGKEEVIMKSDERLLGRRISAVNS